MSQNDEPDNEKSRRKAPAHGLAEAKAFLAVLEKNLGRGPFSRDSMAQALGHAPGSGPFSRKAGSLSHYGLIERSGGAAKISALGISILRPIDKREEQSSTAKAAQMPTLYQELVRRFAGNALPSMLGNILVREFGVHLNSSEEVAKTFRETMAHAGLLRHGILSNTPAIMPLNATEGSEDEAADAGDASIAAPHPSSATAKHADSDELNVGAISASLATMPSSAVDAKVKRDVFALSSGEVIVQWPVVLEISDLQDIEDWLTILIRKMRRAVPTEGATPHEVISERPPASTP